MTLSNSLQGVKTKDLPYSDFEVIEKRTSELHIGNRKKFLARVSPGIGTEMVRWHTCYLFKTGGLSITNDEIWSNLT